MSSTDVPQATLVGLPDRITLRTQGGSPLVTSTEREMEDRYRSYRRAQAAQLLRIVPRAAIRPLYRQARHQGDEAAVGVDPMELLLRYCEKLLPLPPFDVWRRDEADHPDAYWRSLDESPEAPSPAAPSTMAARRFRHDGAPWIALLRGFRDADAWRGSIAFRREGDEATLHHTALIFREVGPTELRDRFRDFRPATLEAFLRSASP